MKFCFNFDVSNDEFDSLICSFLALFSYFEDVSYAKSDGRDHKVSLDLLRACLKGDNEN